MPAPQGAGEEAGAMSATAPATAATATTTTTKVALITGGNRGLGLATAHLLGRAGVTVVIAARDEQQSREAVVALRSEEIWASAVRLDVNDRVSIVRAVERVAREHGRLDILVNNAG